MSRLLGCLMLAALVAAFSWPSAAQTQGARCLPSDSVRQILQFEYGESITAQGTAQSGNVYELWMNKETGTWTIVATLTSGLSCPLARGIDWTIAPLGNPT